MLNRVQIIGRLGQDAEIRSTQAGKEIASISLAVSEKWKDQQGQKQEKTEWIKCSVFIPSAVNFLKNYTAKGDLLFVEGKFTTRKWKDQQGSDKYTTEVSVQPYSGSVQKLSSSGESQPKQSSQAATNNAPADNYDINDSIPF